MKKVLALLLSMLMTLSLAACAGGGSATGSSASAGSAASGSSTTEPVELTVFAAASMTETIDEVIKMYKDVAPNVTITATYDSSGTLLKQIKEGAYCDLFISAAQKQMNALDGTMVGDTDKNPDGLDMIDHSTRVDLLENKVVLVVPEGNPAGIQSFQDLTTDKLKLIALGNSDVPVGSYSLDILKYLGLDVKTLESAGKITYGSNVKEVTTQVSEGTVDCGIIYATDAYSAQQNGSKMTVVDTATSEMCSPILYPAAVLKDSAHPDETKAFLQYLQTPACSKVFEQVGFTALSK